MANIQITPAKLDITAYGGDDTTIAFTLTQEAVPYEYVGTHASQIRPEINSDTKYDLQIQITEEPGKALLIIPSEVAAEVVVDAPIVKKYIGETLIEAPMFEGYWDWNYVDNGEVRTIVFGEITVIGEVTR